jgi:hypothetical protein
MGLDGLVDKVEGPRHAKDAMSVRGVLILPLFCRSDSESKFRLYSNNPGPFADGIRHRFQLRYEKLIRFPAGRLFFSPHTAHGSQRRSARPYFPEQYDRSGRSTGVATVNYESNKQAKDAINRFDGNLAKGKPGWLRKPKSSYVSVANLAGFACRSSFEHQVRRLSAPCD